MDNPSKKVTILGSTGSIGRQALEVCEAGGFAVYGLSAHQNEALLEEQVRRFPASPTPPITRASAPGSPTSRSK